MRRSPLIVLLLCACTGVPSETRPTVITPIYDPARANVPTPNDLAMTDGKVAIANDPSLSDAENLLKAGFNGKDGFSSASAARVQFSGPLSAATVGEDTALAFDLTASGA